MYTKLSKIVNIDMRIFYFVLSILLCLFFFHKTLPNVYQIKPIYLCTFQIPNQITPRYFFIFDTFKCIVIPYGRLQATKLLLFDLICCKFVKYISYPLEAKYLFISSEDTVFWNKLSNPSVFCNDFYFSFRQIYPDLNTGKLYTFLYSLYKDQSDTLPFNAQKIIIRLDTNLFSPYFLKSIQLTLVPLGFTPIKGDSFVLYGFKDETFGKVIQEYICLYTLKTNNLHYLVDLKKIKDFVVNKQWEIPHTYFVDDSLIVFYKYGQTLPFLFSMKGNFIKKLKYKGLLRFLHKSNYIIIKKNSSVYMRIFMHKFLPNEKFIVVIGGKNIGSKSKPLQLKEIYIQYYSKSSLKLIKQKLIKIPPNKSYSYFDCFVLPTNKAKIFLFLLSKNNTVDTYYGEI